jgi:2-polyprenyl-6-methoxyphenol hydroxylase-like FAD-dependent oxidoreductase
MADIDRILIVGGGIAGLTVAAALHQKGFAAELVEREQTWPTIGAGIAVQPNGMRVLNAPGTGAAVERAGAVIHHWGFCDEQGQLLCETDLEALWGLALRSSTSKETSFIECWYGEPPAHGIALWATGPSAIGFRF